MTAYATHSETLVAFKCVSSRRTEKHNELQFELQLLHPWTTLAELSVIMA